MQQRVRIGRLAMLSGLGSTSKDIPPFVLQQGYNCVTGLNIVGLRRAGFTAEAIAALREAFRILYKEGRTRSTALERIEADLGHVAEVAEFVTFIHETTLGINPAAVERAPEPHFLNTARGLPGNHRVLDSATVLAFGTVAESGSCFRARYQWRLTRTSGSW